MVQVKATDELISLLGHLKERAEVLDPSGAVLGYFTPAESPEEQLRRKAFAEYDPEKARRRRESPLEGFTTEQVLAHLRSLEAR